MLTSEKMTTAQECIKAMVVSLHQRHLKGLGFRKNANTWVRGADWSEVINLQLSQWNSSEEAKLTLNLGISIAPLHSLVGGLPLKGTLKEYNCDVRSRIGRLYPHKMDKWWTVTLATDVVHLADELFSELDAFGLPWFHRLSNYAALAEEFVGKKQWFMAAAAQLLNGNRAEAAASMEEAFLTSNELALPKLKRWAEANSIPTPL